MNASPALTRQSKAQACVECGKCSAACSMAAMYPDFSAVYSPRGLVQLALRQAAGQAEDIEPAYLWRCLQCGNCRLSCPEGVDPAGLIAALRAQALAANQGGEALVCDSCGRDMPALPVRQWIEGVLEPGAAPDADIDRETPARPSAYQSLCPVCRRQAYAANNSAG